MDPRLRVELERARREARERKLRLIQIALGGAHRDGPVGWARRFDARPRATDAARTRSRASGSPTSGGDSTAATGN